MTRFLRLSSRIYFGILSLYPPDLHRDFGAEMTEVFGEDLDDAWRSGGVVGVIRVWWCAGCEIMRIALPGQTENPAIVVPAISFALGAITRAAVLMLALRHESATGVHELLLSEAIRSTILWPSLADALISFVAVRRRKCSAAVSLGLVLAHSGTNDGRRDQ